MTDTSAAYNTSAPSGGGATGTRSKIGVSNEYLPPRVSNGDKSVLTGRARAQAATEPDFTQPQSLYYDGAEWEAVAGLSSESRAGIQIALHDMGLIPKNTRPILGAWDAASASAFRQVLAYANQQGYSWDQALEEMSANSDAMGGGGSGASLPTVRLTSPDDLRRIIREGARSVLGSGNVPDDVVERIVSGYHSEESRAGYGAAGGGSVVDAPNAQVYVADALKNYDPQKYDARKVVSGLQAAHQLLAGGSPNG